MHRWLFIVVLLNLLFCIRHTNDSYCQSILYNRRLERCKRLSIVNIIYNGKFFWMKSEWLNQYWMALLFELWVMKNNPESNFFFMPVLRILEMFSKRTMKIQVIYAILTVESIIQIMHIKMNSMRVEWNTHSTIVFVSIKSTADINIVCLQILKDNLTHQISGYFGKISFAGVH